MSYPEWEKKSVNFHTKMAKSPAIQPVWHKFDIDDDIGRQRLYFVIQRALFADEQIIDEHHEDLITDIFHKCIDQSKQEDVVDIAIIYVCVRIEVPKSEYIVPIFRVRNSSEDPEACLIIDHSGNDYENFLNYLENNTWYKSSLMIPSRAQYRLEKNGKCSVLIHDQISRVDPGESSNNFTQLTPKILLNERDIVNSITSIDGAQQAQILNLKKKLHREHDEKFNALRRGYHESIHPGEIREFRGDEKFIGYMNSVGDMNQYFNHFSLTLDGQFRMYDELTIHPRAFAQVPEKARKALLEAIKQLKDMKISLEVVINKQLREIYKDSGLRLVLDRQTFNDLNYLAHKFEVNNLTDVRVGGAQIFANLNATNIERLRQVIQHSLCGDSRYIRLGVDFSTKAGAKNCTEFCAASEYVVRKAHAELKARKRSKPHPKGLGNKKLDDFYKDEIIEEIRNDDFRNVVKSFQELRDECDIVIKKLYPSFKNSFAAANHYDKHKLLAGIDKFKFLLPETYFEIARDMTSASYSEVHWTQDGSSLCCIYLSETTKAIKFVSMPAKTGTIATLLTDDKKTICQPRYYYHPDY